MTEDKQTEPNSPDAARSPEEAAEELGNVDGETPSEQLAEVSKDAPSAPVPPPAIELPKKKWHDRKWLLVSIVAIAAMLLGVGMAAPDRQAAKDEAKKLQADTKSDARDEADEIIEEAEDKREDLLGDAEEEKADLLSDIEAGKGELADVKKSIQTAKANLAATERTRAQKQKQVDKLNRAIRSSTSLSRQNAVGTAEQYLSNQSFSCQGLIDQLEYEQYSNSDATYAAKEVGLC